MMSDELEQFEQRLRRQPLTSVPPEWRAEILAAARARQPQSACRTAPASSARAAFRDRLAAWLWPHPKAWAGVAAVWIVIAILQFSLRDEPAVRLAARNASLATLYDVVPICAFTPFSEHRLMTAPSRFAFMIGTTACMPQNGPSRPMERPHCICSSVVASKRPRVPPPQALFTRMSTVPQSCTAVETMAVTSSLALASVWTKRTSAPNSSRQARATASPAPSSISATRTWAPSRAKRRTMPRPMPSPPPVTIATLSRSRSVMRASP